MAHPFLLGLLERRACNLDTKNSHHVVRQRINLYSVHSQLRYLLHVNHQRLSTRYLQIFHRHVKQSEQLQGPAFFQQGACLLGCHVRYRLLLRRHLPSMKY